MTFCEADGQESVITVWRDGTWKRWGAMDAHYAQGDDGYLVTIPVIDIELEAPTIRMSHIVASPAQHDVIAQLAAACQAELDFYAWHMSAVPSQVLDELVERRAALHAQIRAALVAADALNTIERQQAMQRAADAALGVEYEAGA